jgi:galactose-1-phosphate uridylyltransferase
MLSIPEARIERECPHTCLKECYPLPVKLKSGCLLDGKQIFKNRGNRAGASMTHSHSQIMALPIIVHNIEDELRGAEDYYSKHSRCIFCDVVSHETSTNTARLIDQNEHFVTLAPYAPRFPYETWLIPKQHSSNFESILEDEVSMFGLKSPRFVL